MSVSSLCELLPWDSDFFQCRIGKVRGNTLIERQMSEIEQWSRDMQIECLYFLARLDCCDTIRTAQSHAFDLVDVRVTLECPRLDSSKSPPLNSPEAVIRAAQPEDLPALEEIAHSAHGDSRFFSDPHFSRARSQELYSTWIRRECEGRAQQVLVAASASDHVLGYISCHYKPGEPAGQIGLMAVAEQTRGKGLGRGLVLAALQWFADRGAKEVTVVTQGKNIPALRLYQQSGFFIKDIQFWYHKWFTKSSAGNG